jgi:hypothetical protein
MENGPTKYERSQPLFASHVYVSPFQLDIVSHLQLQGTGFDDPGPGSKVTRPD